MSFRVPDVLERRNNAAAVKKAMLDKFRAVTQDPVLTEQQRLKRIAINEARDAREAEREAARKVREAEMAAQAAREAEIGRAGAARSSKQPRRWPRPRRPNARWRLPPSRKPSAMPATPPARPPKSSAAGATSAADLKFLHHMPQARSGTSNR